MKPKDDSNEISLLERAWLALLVSGTLVFPCCAAMLAILNGLLALCVPHLWPRMPTAWVVVSAAVLAAGVWVSVMMEMEREGLADDDDEWR
jgi:uncharacterized protein YjeT (DUF2065 family)